MMLFLLILYCNTVFFFTLCIHVCAELQGAGAAPAGLLWWSGAWHQERSLAFPFGALQVWDGKK